MTSSVITLKPASVHDLRRHLTISPILHDSQCRFDKGAKRRAHASCVGAGFRVRFAALSPSLFA